MARETHAQKQARALALVQRLDGAMPEAAIELDFRTPLELLVAVLLSAQTTDKRVNLVTPALFARFRAPQDYAAATPAELEPFLASVGLFRSKARSLVALGGELVARHGGQVPRSREVLAQLSGVGRKTAGVVSMHLGGDAAFPVDTHVLRLSARLGLSSHETPDEVEEDLQRLVPRALWFKGHQLLVWHGRRTCRARSPACEACVIADLCPRRGV